MNASTKGHTSHQVEGTKGWLRYAVEVEPSGRAMIVEGAGQRARGEWVFPMRKSHPLPRLHESGAAQAARFVTDIPR